MEDSEADEIRTLGITQLVMSILAAVSCVSAIIIIIATKLYTDFTLRLTLYLSAASLALFIISFGTSALSVSTARNESERVRFCETVGGFVVYSRLSCLVVVVWITAYITKITWCGLLPRFYQKSPRIREVCGVIAVVFLPAVFFWMPYTEDTYGLLGVGCGIQIEYYLNKSEWVFSFDASVAIVSTFSAIMLGAILLLFCKAAYGSGRLAQGHYQRQKIPSQVLHIMLYPLVFALHLILVIIIDIAYYADKQIDYTFLITINSSTAYGFAVLLPGALLIRQDIRKNLPLTLCFKRRSPSSDELGASANIHKEDATLLGINF